MSATPTRDFICALVAAAMRDRPDQNVWEHARENIFLDGTSSLVTRFFDPDLTPYTKLFQEAATGQFTTIHPDDWWLRELLDRGQKVQEFYTVKSSQTGFTQAAINIIIYITRYLAGRGMYCIDSRDKAGKLCKLRILPQLRRLCAEQVSDNEDDLGTYFLQLQNWVWEMVGSYSSGVFSEKPLNFAFADDVEYMVTEGGKRGMLDGVHITDHLRSRLTTADDSFLAVFSKPVDDDSQFIADHRAGSQHQWRVPCPHCNSMLFLQLSDLHYQKPACRDMLGTYDLNAVEALTTVLCRVCKKDIEESWKPRMNAAGAAIPKTREQRLEDKDPLLVPRRLSYTVNDMVSPFESVSWGKLARMLITAEGNPAKLKHVHTNHGATPWRERTISLRGEHIRALCAGAKLDGRIHGEAQGIAPYNRGECPFIPVAVTATSDKQGDQLKWTLCAWKLDGTMALIEYGATLADRDLLQLSENPLNHAGLPILCKPNPELFLYAGYGMESGGCLIDSGFDTFDVYDFCAASGWRWYPSKGVPGLTMTGVLVEAKRDFKDGREILRYHYNDYQLKVAFYKGKIELHSHPNPKLRRTSNLYLPADIGEDFIAELTSESLRPDPRTGKMLWHHDKTIGPNDWGDAMKKQLALWQIIGPELHRANVSK